VVDTARHAQGLVINVVDFEAANSRIGGGAGDFGLEELFELESPCGLARGRVAREEDKLHACESAIDGDGDSDGAEKRTDTHWHCRRDLEV
jgi:hypothetical protein